jgi:hypothetical protein
MTGGGINLESRNNSVIYMEDKSEFTSRSRKTEQSVGRTRG